MLVQFSVKLSGKPARAAADVRELFSRLGLRAGAVEAADAELGIWNVEVESGVVWALETFGQFEKGGDAFGQAHVAAEMP